MNDWLKDRPMVTVIIGFVTSLLTVLFAFSLNSWSADKQKVVNDIQVLKETKATYTYVDNKVEEVSEKVEETKVDIKDDIDYLKTRLDYLIDLKLKENEN